MPGARAAPWILVGYFIVHVFEHSLPAHFHFGEETHAEEFLHPRSGLRGAGRVADPYVFRWGVHRLRLHDLELAGHRHLRRGHPA